MPRISAPPRSRYGKLATGIAQKPDDSWTTPLCVEHHLLGEEAQHQENEIDFWAQHGIDPFVLALALWRASGDDELGFLVLLEAGKREHRQNEIPNRVAWSSTLRRGAWLPLRLLSGSAFSLPVLSHPVAQSMTIGSDFQTRILRRATSPEEYRVYRAALEWDLDDPIVIDSASDFKSTRRWQDRLTPYHHQVTNLITFCRRLPVTLLADDVGLGKTISAGLIMSELISRSRLSKVLIVCPKLLAPQWQAELSEKFDIVAEIAIGKELVDADPEGFGAVITTYNSARLYLDATPKGRFQMLVLDEAHRLRNLYGLEKTPQVARRFRKALQERRFQFVLMLTATPIQNRLWDLYSLGRPPDRRAWT